MFRGCNDCTLIFFSRCSIFWGCFLRTEHTLYIVPSSSSSFGSCFYVSWRWIQKSSHTFCFPFKCIPEEEQIVKIIGLFQPPALGERTRWPRVKILAVSCLESALRTLSQGSAPWAVMMFALPSVCERHERRCGHGLDPGLDTVLIFSSFLFHLLGKGDIVSVMPV